MRIVADENIPYLHEFFAGLGEVTAVPGRQLQACDVKNADALLVRSVTPVTETLLRESAVRFVASATIGTDHVDQTLLAQRGIGFASAPGCNADAVVDYVLSALLNLAAETGTALDQQTLGIVGLGNVGTRLYQRLSALGCRVLCNDPPRQQAGDDSHRWDELQTLLECCDVLCLHTPLHQHGAHPSYHLFDESRLSTLKKGGWLINAGRGGVIDNEALNRILTTRQDLRVVLDVWEHEPGINAELAGRVHWGTPHIAGYSLEGRARGTEMIYQAFCDFFDLPATQQLGKLLPTPEIQTLQLGHLASGRISAVDVMNLCYDMRQDHQALSALMTQPAVSRAAGFDQLRRDYPSRREFSSIRVSAVDHPLAPELAALGFTLIDS